jgi:branched-chain amino acid transport system substrate-binding protein
MAIRGDVQRAGIPQVSLAGGTVITADFDPLVFQTPWSNTIVVPFVLEAVKASGATKIAVLSDTGGYGKDGKPIIEQDAPTLGLEIVANETFKPGDADMTAQLTKVRGSGAQAVVLWTAGKEAATIMKNAEGLGMTSGDERLSFFGGSGQARIEFAEGAGQAAEGFTFGTGKSLIPSNWGEGTPQYSAVNDFAERYSETYGAQPDIFAGHAFDAISIIAAGIERAGADSDGAALRDALESTQGLLGYGGTFTFTPTDHNGLTADDLSLYRFQGGTWVAAP